MEYTGPILALLTSAAGWYYLFYSKAAVRLAQIEAQDLNRRRSRLRRVGGGVMFVLGIGLYVGFRAADTDNDPLRFVVVWLLNMTLMATLVVFALIDVRLTSRLRKRLRSRDSADAPTTRNDPGQPPAANE
ncbi:hypothetical protein [Humisphaera borealis]|uniref:DUF3784 domain-containing protein n=1 Tax=Humisphaera borealis TaxID=2807512 RepID=A0A7M2WVK3_9BACT|nr:hypothetical protein [Humisphaera borealis]QOV88510.1 hypothetical protein IPV69_20025 [Humisphaera borealis]